MTYFRLRINVEERQTLIDELDGVDPVLREKLLSLRDQSKQTAGVYEFRGLDCASCGVQTPHFKLYKSNERWRCDECGS